MLEVSYYATSSIKILLIHMMQSILLCQSFYGSESVEDAKQLLWQSYSSHLGTYPQHKGKKTKEKKS